jgi:hypothetical protein
MQVVYVFNMFPHVLCVHKPFLAIYIFLLFTPFLLSLFRSVKEGFYCIYLLSGLKIQQCLPLGVILT